MFVCLISGRKDDLAHGGLSDEMFSTSIIEDVLTTVVSRSLLDNSSFSDLKLFSPLDIAEMLLVSRT